MAYRAADKAMSLGLVGKKIGMTRVFTEQGQSCSVTIIEVLPNRITQIKTVGIDGYDGVQVTTGTRRAKRVTRAMQGHFTKAGVEPGRNVWEFRIPEAINVAVGSELTVDLFTAGQKVDVSGQSIGRGFAGVIKRHGFAGGRASHGNSKAHRLAGSIGNAQDPGRVFKGKKMAGQMGAAKTVQQNLDVVRVDGERNIIFIAGPIPGCRGGDVLIRPAVKSKQSLNVSNVANAQPAKSEQSVSKTEDDKSDTDNVIEAVKQ